MNFQISIVGICVIAVYSFLVLLIVAWPLRKLLTSLRWKWAVIAPPTLALLALPWAEEYWIASRFHEACKDAGVHITRKVEVEGFYDATMRTGFEQIKQYGYRFMEHPAADDRTKVEHVEKDGEQWRVRVLDHPTARYHYKRAYQPTPYVHEEPIDWKLIKTGTLVVDSTTGEVIGRDVTYTRFPNIADWQVMRFFGSGGYSCPNPEKGPRQPQFPQAVLIPIKTP